MSAVEHLGYAEALATRRRCERERIHHRVLHPIDTPALLRDPLARRSSHLRGTVTLTKLALAAVVIHAVTILVLYAVSELVGTHETARRPEILTVQVLDTEPPPIVESEPVASDFKPEPEPEPEPEIKPKLEPEPVKPPVKPRPRPKRPQPAVTDEPQSQSTPPDPGNQQPDNQPVRRRRLGISLDSTVTDGSGPAMATGDSRMGETSTTAQSPSRSPSSATGTGSSGRGARRGSSQRAATNIPTRDAVFVKPKRMTPSKPTYPATLKAQGIEGDVKVRVELDAKGQVTDVAVLASSGHKAFDDAAVAAARKERFKPAIRDGKTVPFSISYSYRFRIEE